MTDFSSQKGAQREPKSNQKATKNRCKKRSEKNIAIRSSWGRLGAILGHFRSLLGAIFIDFSLVFKAFCEISPFLKNITSATILDRTWPD